MTQPSDADYCPACGARPLDNTFMARIEKLSDGKARLVGYVCPGCGHLEDKGIVRGWLTDKVDRTIERRPS